MRNVKHAQKTQTRTFTHTTLIQTDSGVPIGNQLRT